MGNYQKLKKHKKNMLGHILNMFLEFTLCKYDKLIEHVNSLIELLKDTENLKCFMMMMH